MSSGQLCDPDHPCVTVVFFGSKSYDLTESKLKAISAAVDEWRHWGMGKIAVLGHTDAVENPQNNMVLSDQRAGAVAAQLVADGVPKDLISVKGLGDTSALVPTYGSAPQAFNRRVEIWIEQQ